ncbi:MAG: hypothetical protein OXI87_07190 [Albidovulum sp.]|nr:hypothetical protein [Albidovulum sp.]MDE0530396.1 hypothetical protein [Albidovulum sp.]
MQDRTEDDGMLRQFRKMVRRSRRGSQSAWAGWPSTMTEEPVDRLKFAAKRIRNTECLIIATNMDLTRRALRLYRRGWRTGRLFSNAETRRHNNEGADIADPAKLVALLDIAGLALTGAHRCAASVMERKPIWRKKHERLEKFWFRTGFDARRLQISNDRMTATGNG